MITREEAKELLPIMQAFVEGKQIQDKIDDLTDWVDTNGIILEFNGKKIQHRIKPGPNYRPFKNQEECWQEMHKHTDFGWIRNKNTKELFNITNIFSNAIRLTSYNEKFSSTLSRFEFLDGEPFGIKDE